MKKNSKNILLDIYGWWRLVYCLRPLFGLSNLKLLQSDGVRASFFLYVQSTYLFRILCLICWTVFEIQLCILITLSPTTNSRTSWWPPLGRLQITTILKNICVALTWPIPRHVLSTNDGMLWLSISSIVPALQVNNQNNI